MTTFGPNNLPAYLSNNADFETWAQGIHNALVGVGLVQTADTGQATLATFAKPAAAWTAGGYEIFRFGDALQATVPMFIKIEYGVAGLVTTPLLVVTAGSSTDGAGNITGAKTVRAYNAPSYNAGLGVTAPCYASGDGSRFSLAWELIAAGSQAPCMLAVERTRDQNGNYTADGWVMLNDTWGTQPGFCAFSMVGGVAVIGSAFSNGPLISPIGAGVWQYSYGGNIALATMVYFVQGLPRYGLSAVGHQQSLAPNTVGATFVATVLGAAHTYLVYGVSTMNESMICYQSTDPLRTSILWE